ncbi:hypothetical protein SCP_1603310 [Sparassis crispa]|uniref:Fungal-type protein kinase domain-containing protein n=1 Tax=Sparassis crispa TaxID=139825 RepID=A0A401H5E7_9APHY|nr:hypothetical protein SCP_1603310 [Sparassis crispa]GBE89667.1 hypothetical protein SCP_1603310 [Sparassis crispa]
MLGLNDTRIGYGAIPSCQTQQFDGGLVLKPAGTRSATVACFVRPYSHQSPPHCARSGARCELIPSNLRHTYLHVPLVTSFSSIVHEVELTIFIHCPAPQSLPSLATTNITNITMALPQNLTADPTLPHHPITPPRPSMPAYLNKNNIQQWSFLSNRAKRCYRRYACEAKDLVVGPMPAAEFLQFLPQTKEKMPDSKEAFVHVPARAKLEEEIYTPLITALNGMYGQSRCPNFVFCDTSTRGVDHGAPGSVKPDVCCYATHRLELVELNKATKGPVGDLGLADLFIEVKREPGQDYFRDPGPEVDRALHKFILSHCKVTTLALGQHIAYAAESLGRQHRRVYFSAALAGSMARLIRWDRAGAIVSESFDLHKEPEVLCEFFWRYSHASEAERGYDLTVEVATGKQETFFKNSIERHVQMQLDLEDMSKMAKREKVSANKKLAAGVTEHYQKGRVFAVTTLDSQRKKHRILISRPLVMPLSIADRAIRYYWAVDADGDSGNILLLKDTWRDTAPDIPQEGNVLAVLLESGVPAIPQLNHHGDVPEGEGSEGQFSNSYVWSSFNGGYEQLPRLR